MQESPKDKSLSSPRKTESFSQCVMRSSKRNSSRSKPVTRLQLPSPIALIQSKQFTGRNTLNCSSLTPFSLLRRKLQRRNTKQIVWRWLTRSSPSNYSWRKLKLPRSSSLSPLPTPSEEETISAKRNLLPCITTTTRSVQTSRNYSWITHNSNYRPSNSRWNLRRRRRKFSRWKTSSTRISGWAEKGEMRALMITQCSRS